jgi:uncharacterized protein with HEPN domain
MQPRDKALLWDIVQASNDIREFSKDLNYSEFEKDKKTRFAIERLLLIIGEASNHISDETKQEYSGVPWKRIIGLRNILAHEYGEVLIDQIWKICNTGIDELLSEIPDVKFL